MLLSVIIPTHKRAAILAQCLRHLEAQTIAKDIEVIIVDDTNDKETAQVVRGQKSVISTLLSVSACHQGAARNAGVAVAKGERILFIGDDIFLEPEACERHIYVNKEWSVVSNQWVEKTLSTTCYPLPAILGFTTWDPACGITPVMRWLETSGWQFGYPSIARYAHGCIPPAVQHRYTYTSHISVPLEIAKKFPFREDVSLYGWEDVEWGMRLRDAGVPLVYEPDARALHHHHITLEASLKRMEVLGRSAVEIAKKVPEFDRVPRGGKLLAYRILSLFPTMAGRHRKAFFLGTRFDYSSSIYL